MNKTIIIFTAILSIHILCTSVYADETDIYDIENTRSAANRYQNDRKWERPRKALSDPESERDIHNIFIVAESDFLSQYLWRGMPLSDGFVWQPSATVEIYNFGFNIWTNMPLTDEANQGEFNEVDFSFYYTENLGDFTISPRVQFVVYPNANPLSLDYSSDPSLKLILQASYRIGKFDFFSDLSGYLYKTKNKLYFEIGIGFHQEITENFEFNTSALTAIGSSSFNRVEFGVDETKLNIFEYSAGFTWFPAGGLAVNPLLRVSTLLPDSLRGSVTDPTLLSYGLEIKYDF